MRVLAFDASLSQTGVAFPDGSLDTIRPPKAMRGGERLAWLDDTFRVLIDAHRPTVVAYEQPLNLPRNGDLRELYGCLRAQIWRGGAVAATVYPSTLKLAATGSGRATKGQMIEAARRLGFDPANGDEADAALLLQGITHGWFTKADGAA